MRILIVALAACWTGTAPVPPPSTTQAPAARPRLEITLSRTACFGNCPVYRLQIHDSGNFEWTGERNVETVGTRTGALAAADLEVIDRAITDSQFFQRDNSGQLQEGPQCVKSGNTTSCSWKSVVICSDTSHTVLTIRRGSRTHTIDNAHCSDEPDEITMLENEIVYRSKIAEWIGD